MLNDCLLKENIQAREITRNQKFLKDTMTFSNIELIDIIIT